MLAIVVGHHQTCGKLSLTSVCDHTYHIEVTPSLSVRRSWSCLRIVSNNTYLNTDPLRWKVIRVLIIVAISAVSRSHVRVGVLLVDLVVLYLAVVCSLE